MNILDLKKTHLYTYHIKNGNVVDFGGFAMPVWFEGIIPEHHSVRNSVGIFDTSHMGRTFADGTEAEKFVNWVVTNNVSNLGNMEGLYTVMLKPDAGIVDDLITYKLSNNKFFIVYNAANREKDFNWLKKNSKGFDVELKDVSDEIAMIAVQGPKAEETLQRITDEDLSHIDRFNLGKVKISSHWCMAARTGYTGEDGFEIFVIECSLEKPEKALDIWRELIDLGATPCGLGARDSLRLEAGLNLYGNDITEKTNPLEARLRWVVKFKKEGGFIGKEALEAIRKEGLKRSQVGIEIIGRGIPRQHYEIFDVEEKRIIGEVTSGGFSPTLGVGIALGYIEREYRKIGTPVKIRIRHRMVDGKIVKSHPFYDDSVYGWKRKKG